jgi:hypothetical protein
MKKHSKKLTLSRETLHLLTEPNLQAVAAATGASGCICTWTDCSLPGGHFDVITCSGTC